jgi:hypothetical protein
MPDWARCSSEQQPAQGGPWAAGRCISGKQGGCAHPRCGLRAWAAAPEAALAQTAPPLPPETRAPGSLRCQLAPVLCCRPRHGSRAAARRPACNTRCCCKEPLLLQGDLAACLLQRRLLCLLGEGWHPAGRPAPSSGPAPRPAAAPAAPRWPAHCRSRAPGCLQARSRPTVGTQAVAVDKLCASTIRGHARVVAVAGIP